MSLKDAFHDHLDEAWPLWKRHKDGVKYQQLYRAFLAGYKIADEGLSPAQLGDAGQPMSVLEAITSPPRKFRPPRRRRS
jgi:hypothetical protein